MRQRSLQVTNRLTLHGESDAVGEDEDQKRVKRSGVQDIAIPAPKVILIGRRRFRRMAMALGLLRPVAGLEPAELASVV